MSTPTPKHAGPTPIETALGGIEIEVDHVDGTRSSVKVRQIPISQFQKLARNESDDFAMAGIFCDKDQDWVFTLTPPSFTAIVETGRRVNRDFFSYCTRTVVATLLRVKEVDPDKFERLIPNPGT